MQHPGDKSNKQNARHKKPGTKQCGLCDFIYLHSKHRQSEWMVLEAEIVGILLEARHRRGQEQGSWGAGHVHF